MTTRDDASALVERMQECFNTRRFDDAADLFAPGFFSHPLGTAGFATTAWHALTARYPGMRVVAQDVLVDGDRAAVRSSVEGIGGAEPVLFEIFRFDGGRFVEMWGATAGFPDAASPEDLFG
jgi:predicted SnoaL-like aldol condensation-catalyzing enzyme